jgi:hypothetical protein
MPENGPRLSTAQRLILILYCAALAYCCLWIPWRFGSSRYAIVEYDWLWAQDMRAPSGYRLGAPDVLAIILRMVFVSALAGAAFLIAGLFCTWRAKGQQR